MRLREGDDLKETNEQLIADIVRDEGISPAQASKKFVPEAWDFEERYLQECEGLRRWQKYNSSKPYEVLKDPSKDKYPWEDAKHLMKLGAGLPPIAIEYELSNSPEATDITNKALEAFKRELEKDASFGDVIDTLKSGEKKHEEVKALKKKWNDEAPKPINKPWYYTEKLRDQWLIAPAVKVKLRRDELLTRDWNYLPPTCPLYKLGNREFFRLFYDFNPLLMSICDVNASQVGSLIAYYMELKGAFGWFQLNEEMEDVIGAFKRWLDGNGCPDGYAKGFLRTRLELRKRIKEFKEQPNRYQLVIMAYLDIKYGWQDDVGNLTIKDLKEYLMENHPKQFPRELYDGNKEIWRNPMTKAREWVPLAIAFERDYNTKQTPDQDVQRWLNSAPSGEPDLT